MFSGRFSIDLERRLLLVAGAFICVNFFALSLIRPQATLSHIVAFLIWVACAGGGHYVLSKYLPQRDQMLFPVVMMLSGWGLVTIDRLFPRFADRQMLWLMLSVAVMLAVAIFPHTIRWLRNYRYMWLIFGFALLISTIQFGQNPSGSLSAPPLWLGLGGLYFQPSEALKIILVAFLASYLGEQYPLIRAEREISSDLGFPLSPRIFGPIVLMWALSVIILVWQRDLGTATLFFIVFLVLLYAASGNIYILLSGLILIFIAGLAAYNRFDVVRLRVDIWINPWVEADGDAFQIVQSLHAIASGGILGSGIAQGSPLYIPVVHSDFIFAAIGEEWGFIGIITVIACIALIMYRGFRTAINQNRPFYTLLGIGLSTLIATQSLLIMGGVIRLVPLTGVTLPFLSYGGSSLLMSFIMLGLLLRLSAKVN
ncbi:MAG: FtsW/RodA/SpoVE family cell cycle protein [Aggregatilineales bacterium]